MDVGHAKASEMIVEGSVSASSAVMRTAAAVDDGHPTKLTAQQESFVYAFLDNGGNAAAAALTAGYSHDTYGSRVLAKKHVQAEIARRVKLQTGSALAIALTGLFRVIESPGSDERAVVAAALGLMDRFGMAVPKGPMVAIQNNTLVGGAQQVADILADVAKKRADRLALAPPASDPL